MNLRHAISAFAAFFVAVCLGGAVFATTASAQMPRAREIGVPFDGSPGPLNAITDVAAIEVGHTTLISGEGPLIVGQGPVRTGITAILPRGKDSVDIPVFAGWFSQNGNGEMTGTAWVEESGFLEGPVMITNTHSVGVVRDAVIKWRVDRGGPDASGYWWSLPVVAETWDGWLNDINGFHVTAGHAVQALDSAAGGRVAEGNVGGGTGMICYGFKGGIGTSSRAVKLGDTSYTIGVLLQANFGGRSQLLVAGVPVGREFSDSPAYSGLPGATFDVGSVIVVVATDAPLLPHQLKRLARRVTMGIARTGSVSGNGSGDLFIAFSTANAGACRPEHPGPAEFLGNDRIDPVFTAVVQATEESVINALVAAETMTGQSGHRAVALPHDRLQDALKRYNRLALPEGREAYVH
jgi:D-aminopeptidase